MRCRKRVYGFGRNHPLFLYHGLARELLHAYKFEGHVRLAEFFANEVAADHALNRRANPLVPVPPRPRARRGQSATHVSKVVKLLEHRFGLEIADVLIRRSGIAQKDVDCETRLVNLQGKFVLREDSDRARISGRTFLLFDDIMTTGATLDECARVLIESGADGVDACTIAID